jgi:hypothetical protein
MIESKQRDQKMILYVGSTPVRAALEVILILSNFLLEAHWAGAHTSAGCVMDGCSYPFLGSLFQHLRHPLCLPSLAERDRSENDVHGDRLPVPRLLGLAVGHGCMCLLL